MIREGLIVLVLLSAFAVGLLLARICREELVSGRKWFKIILAGCSLVIFILLFVKVSYKLEIILGLIYLGIISLVSLKLSYNFKN